MRTFWKWALVLAAGAVWAVPARTAEQEAVPDATTVQLLLLRQKSVQQELKVSPELARKILEFCNKDYAEARKVVKLSGQARKQKFEEMEQANKRFLEDNLSEAQRKRLKQIGLQVTGLHQLTRPEAAKLLNLTEKQQNTFKEMQKEARQKLVQILEAKDREGRKAKLAKLHQAVHQAIERVLTDEQKAKVRELVGEPFTGDLQIEEPEGPTSFSSPPAWRAAPSVGVARSPARGPGRPAA
jgi:hypothetical protein